MSSKKVVMVVDAQGGGLGKQLITAIRKALSDIDIQILAVGTNSTATGAMLKAGADEAATGENAARVASRKADVIIGPVGMVIADAMLGEITPMIACTIAQAAAKRIMIPFSSCDNYIAGVSDFSTGRLMAEAVQQLRIYLTEE
ncbi:DUF3842 family protein [Lachnoclostridium sp. Marseille-P6806]|uniref:DUF3842 family protein n=1 Tax=Lachnoclostridium sp. Marseille-P6806 TaxID=2364793 RepID=UPI00102F658E|nr:DUF3842 family protein [Lachnoclostridium sp. Marseille-P6806]